MLIKIICIIALLEFSLSEYDATILPMDKESKYGNDVCSYTDDRQTYVKPCGKGKFCGDDPHINTIPTLDYSRGKYYATSTMEICQDLPNISILYTYKEEGCTNDFECEEGKCIGNVCSNKCDTGKFYYKEIYGGSPGCKEDSKKGDTNICYEITHYKNEVPTEKFSPPVPNKICGKLTFLDEPYDGREGMYYVHTYEYVYKGEVEDGEYVNNEELCKSGFALYFFKDGKSEDPKDVSITGYNNEMYLRCVTPISVSKIGSKCTINYKINESGEILRYNVNKLNYLGQNPSTYFNKINEYCDEEEKSIYIKLKYEKYREFYTKIIEEERKTCGDLDKLNKYTCENNELIKAWYFYNNPKDYFTYNNRKKIEKVIDYKIQKKYPCYSLSQFLTIKIIYLLFLLLF